MKKVIVIGAGASGLIAAMSAARCGAEVMVLEHMKKPGRKLLVTGNGRCNLSNLSMVSADQYSSMTDRICKNMKSEAGAFVRQVFASFGVSETLELFETLGVPCINRDGLVYPASEQASTVLDALLRELTDLGVTMKYAVEPRKICYDASRHCWQVLTDGWRYEADSLILCCGSKAAPQTGSDGSGYELARMAGHRVTKLVPALTGLVASDPAFGSCDGARTQAIVRLLDPDGCVSQVGQGQIQWTSYGVSGIVIFQLSRFLSDIEKDKEAVLSIDLVPDRTAEQVEAIIKKTCRCGRIQLPPKVILQGWTHERVAAVLARQIGKESEPERIAATLAALLKDLRIRVKGLRPFAHAQVTAGGVFLSEVDPVSLRSRIAPELYLAGELLDIDGSCGGYNLQWAWSSGWVAGQAAGLSAGTGLIKR